MTGEELVDTLKYQIAAHRPNLATVLSTIESGVVVSGP